MKTDAPHTGKYVAYYRVSTSQQGQSGLGLEAQKKAVLGYLNGGKWELVAEFTEIESGKRAKRPQLEAALKLCKKAKATLVIAKLDRLSRNVHFITGLAEKRVQFVAADNPHANNFVVNVLACVAEWEAEMISKRTKEGLERAKARGVKLGRYGATLARENAARATAFARELRPAVNQIRAGGNTSVRKIMAELNHRGILTSLGKTWGIQTTYSLLKRIDG